MKTITLIIALTAFLATTFVSTAETMELDTKKSKITWTGKKITGSSHTGTIKFKSGSMDISSNSLSNGKFDADMTTLKNTDITDKDMNAKLIGHLKSDDFFSVDKHKTASFKINSAKKRGDKFKIKGSLTIKGITHAIVFDAKLTKSGKGYKATADVVFDRSKYDVKFHSGSFFENLGDNLIFDDIELKLELYLSADMVKS
jgi:polyisoprenoid-binding protein YceI